MSEGCVAAGKDLLSGAEFAFGQVSEEWKFGSFFKGLVGRNAEQPVAEGKDTMSADRNLVQVSHSTSAKIAQPIEINETTSRMLNSTRRTSPVFCGSGSLAILFPSQFDEGARSRSLLSSQAWCLHFSFDYIGQKNRRNLRVVRISEPGEASVNE